MRSVPNLLALGVHPQQWFIQAAAQPLPTDSTATRARNQVTVFIAGAVRGAFRVSAHEPGWPPIRPAATAPGQR